MRQILLVIISIFFLVSCKKEAKKSSSQSSGGTNGANANVGNIQASTNHYPSDADGLILLSKLYYSDSTNHVNLDYAAKPTFCLSGGYLNQSGYYMYVGNIYINSSNFGFTCNGDSSSQSYMYYNGMTPSVNTFSVSGSPHIQPFRYTHVSSFNDFSGFNFSSVNSHTVLTSQAFTYNHPLISGDSIKYTIYGSNYIWYSIAYHNSTSVTFSASTMGILGSTHTAYLTIEAFHTTPLLINNKKIYIIDKTSASSYFFTLQ